MALGVGVAEGVVLFACRTLDFFRGCAPLPREAEALFALRLFALRAFVGWPVAVSTTFGKNSISGISSMMPLSSSNLIRSTMSRMYCSDLPSPRLCITQVGTPLT
jgi:hypothetical protein